MSHALFILRSKQAIRQSARGQPSTGSLSSIRPMSLIGHAMSSKALFFFLTVKRLCDWYSEHRSLFCIKKCEHSLCHCVLEQPADVQYLKTINHLILRHQLPNDELQKCYQSPVLMNRFWECMWDNVKSVSLI